MVTVPAMAADPEPTKKDLKGISPQRYKYLFSVAGGAALGAGIGAIAGGAPNVGKGILIGGGGASALYLHTHKKDTLHGWRNWAYVASYTSFGGGLGWTLCGCNRGLVSGILIGGGVTGIWLAEHPQHTTPTAGTNNTNNP
ncbi:MAG TPA: hypothetical protein VMU28_07005 [Terriglobales bacterium]|nr:hypothetical protein [Terriglobales bacterium]